MDMSELKDVGKLLEGATSGGWGSFAAIIAVGLIILAAAMRSKKGWIKQLGKKTMKRRHEERAENPKENARLEDDHARAEDDIAKIIEERSK